MCGRPAIQLSWVKLITGGLALTNQGLYSSVYLVGHKHLKKSQVNLNFATSKFL